jgi:N-terminal acetyltransferase B complex non-catalytic subunit
VITSKRSNSSESKVRTEIEAHLDPGSGIDKSWRRNASLAWVKVAFKDTSTFTIAMTTDKTSTTSLRCDTILKYLADYGDATTAYSDLRPYVEKLTIEERKQLLGFLNTTSTNVSLIWKM